MHTHVPQMFEGKERRRDLIAELRTTHALQSPEQKEKRRESEALHSKQVSSEREEHKVTYTVSGPWRRLGLH